METLSASLALCEGNPLAPMVYLTKVQLCGALMSIGLAQLFVGLKCLELWLLMAQTMGRAVVKSKASRQPIFTRGQFWPSGIVFPCFCLCMRPFVRPSIRPCVNPELVRAMTHQPFGAKITKFGPEV